jgi:SAM-dependent methyltransferase
MNGGREPQGDATARLARLWEDEAGAWALWARTPGHDAYWRFHRDAFLRLLPPPGRLTLDVGCGEGRLMRDLALRGHRVVGVDAAPTMVRLARAAGPRLAVTLADAAALPIAAGAADLVVAFMSLQDIDSLDAAVLEARRVLDDRGRLCVAIVHPLSSAGVLARASTGSAAPVRPGYLDEWPYRDEVERNGLRMTFHSRHRPLEAYSRAFEEAGLLVEAIREVTVDEASVAERPERARWLRIPIFLHLRLRPAAGGPVAR